MSTLKWLSIETCGARNKTKTTTKSGNIFFYLMRFLTCSTDERAFGTKFEIPLLYIDIKQKTLTKARQKCNIFWTDRRKRLKL